MKKILDLFRNSLCLKKLAFFVQIFGKILRTYEYIWSKNFAEKMPKRAILANKWNFERGLLLFLLIPFSLMAQEWDNQVFNLENNPPPFFPISVSGSYLNVSKTHFRTPGFQNETLKYRQTEAAFAFTHPFSQFCGLIFGAGWIGTEVDMQNNPNFDETLFNYANLSLGGFNKTFPDWTWTLTLAAYLDLENFSFIDYALYDGVLWGKYDLCKSIELDFGAIVEVGLHKERVWPIVGFVYLPCDNWRISVVYPVDISVKYSFFSYWRAGGSIRFLRNRHRVGPNQPNPQSIFEYRTAGGELDLTFEPVPFFSITGFTGSTFNGDFKVTNRNNHHATHYKFKGSFYSGLSAILSF